MKTRSFYSPVDDKEKIFGESETIPDQSLSVRDIITRYRRGSMELPPIETGDDDDIDAPDFDFDDISAMDSVRIGNDILQDYSAKQTSKTASGDEQPIANADN